MKRLKRGFVAFFVGEFLALFKKDQKFKKGVVEKSGFEKIKHILDGMLDFNKQLVEEVKEQFDTNALEEQLQKGASWVESEYTNLLVEIEALKEKGVGVTTQLIGDLQARLDQFTHTALLLKDQVSSFDVKEKIQELKKMLESLAKQIKKQ